MIYQVLKYRHLTKKTFIASKCGGATKLSTNRLIAGVQEHTTEILLCSLLPIYHKSYLMKSYHDVFEIVFSAYTKKRPDGILGEF